MKSQQSKLEASPSKGGSRATSRASSKKGPSRSGSRLSNKVGADKSPSKSSHNDDQVSKSKIVARSRKFSTVGAVQKTYFLLFFQDVISPAESMGHSSKHSLRGAGTQDGQDAKKEQQQENGEVEEEEEQGETDAIPSTFMNL